VISIDHMELTRLVFGFSLGLLWGFGFGFGFGIGFRFRFRYVFVLVIVFRFFDFGFGFAYVMHFSHMVFTLRYLYCSVVVYILRLGLCFFIWLCVWVCLCDDFLTYSYSPSFFVLWCCSLPSLSFYYGSLLVVIVCD
jgi:hypothetical protein